MTTLQPTRATSGLVVNYRCIDFNYFKIKAKVNHPAEPCMELPDPKGPLSAAVPSSTIIAVNKKLKFKNEEVCRYK